MICIGQAAVHLAGLQRSVELAAIGRRVCEQEWDLLDLVAPAATAAVQAEGAPPPAIGDGPSGDSGGTLVATTPLGPTAPVPASPAGPGLHGRPTAAELVEAVRDLLSDQVLAAVGGRLRFHVRVAANALGIVERELSAGGDAAGRHAAGLAQLGVVDEAALAAGIRDGAVDIDDGDIARFLARSAYDRLQVANPGYP